jgi:histidinol-phosphate/aromatic aminotransferase/cobyric acid decarboxylase-like protein
VTRRLAETDVARDDGRKDFLLEEAPDLARDLRALGMSVLEGVANYVLSRLPDDGPEAHGVIADSRALGLFLRDLESLSGRFDSRTFRIAVKDAGTNRRMIEILSGVLASRAGH